MFAQIWDVDSIYVLGGGDPISFDYEEGERISATSIGSMVCIDSYGCEKTIINNVHGGPIFGAGYGVFYKADINNVTGYIGCRGRSCLESAKIDVGRNGGVIVSGNYGGYSIEINDWPDEPVIGYGTKVFCHGIFYNVGSIFAVGYKALCNAYIENVPTVYVSGEGGLKGGEVRDFTTVIISGIYGCLGCILSPKPGIHTTVVFKGPGPVSPGGEVSDVTEVYLSLLFLILLMLCFVWLSLLFALFFFVVFLICRFFGEWSYSFIVFIFICFVAFLLFFFFLQISCGVLVAPVVLI